MIWPLILALLAPMPTEYPRKAALVAAAPASNQVPALALTIMASTPSNTWELLPVSFVIPNDRDYQSFKLLIERANTSPWKPTPTLAGEANAELQQFLRAGTNNHSPHIVGLATNKSLWTWPLDLSCYGQKTDSDFGAVLIAPGLVVLNEHVLPGRFTFTSTNGNAYTANVKEFQYVVYPWGGTNDWVYGVLESNMPPDITPAMVFPPEVTQYLTNGFFDGMQGFAIQRTTGNVLSGNIVTYPSGALGWEQGTNKFNGALGDIGDSSSPCLISLNGHIVHIFSTTSGGGWPIFYKLIWDAMPTNSGVRCVDLGGFRKQ